MVDGCGSRKYVDCGSAILAGEAFRFWEAISTTSARVFNWTQFKQQLAQAFDAVEQDSRARMEKDGTETYHCKFLALLAKVKVKPLIPDHLHSFRIRLVSKLVQGSSL